MHRSLGKFFVLALSFFLVPAAFAQHYAVTDVGTLGSDTDANALNSYGLVVGTSAALSGIVHAFSSKDERLLIWVHSVEPGVSDRGLMTPVS